MAVTMAVPMGVAMMEARKQADGGNFGEFISSMRMNFARNAELTGLAG